MVLFVAEGDPLELLVVLFVPDATLLFMTSARAIVDVKNGSAVVTATRMTRAMRKALRSSRFN
jgi:hypothetical protein